MKTHILINHSNIEDFEEVKFKNTFMIKCFNNQSHVPI